MQLKDKVALITGGGTGLGRAIALALAAEGMHVAVNYSRSEAEALATVEDLKRLGVQARAVRADVSISSEVEAMVRQTGEWLGRIDFLVNNAGVTSYVPMSNLEDMTEDRWDRIMDVNAKGAFLCSRAVAPVMRGQGGGKIVNVSSNSGLAPEGSCLAYCVSKAAIIMLTKCLAKALAPQVQVNALAPGFMDTRWLQAYFPPERQEYLKETEPMARPEEVAAAAVFLAQNDTITGQTLVVDNGVVMH